MHAMQHWAAEVCMEWRDGSRHGISNLALPFLRDGSEVGSACFVREPKQKPRFDTMGCGAVLVLLSAGIASHTAFTASQLKPVTSQASEYGLERYTAFLRDGPCAWLLIHTTALWLLLR